MATRLNRRPNSSRHINIVAFIRHRILHLANPANRRQLRARRLGTNPNRSLIRRPPPVPNQLTHRRSQKRPNDPNPHRAPLRRPLRLPHLHHRAPPNRSPQIQIDRGTCLLIADRVGDGGNQLAHSRPARPNRPVVPPAVPAQRGAAAVQRASS